MTDAGRGRVPRTDMGTGSALAVLGALQDAGVRTWLIGGWAIDALVGRQRRPHDDLDLLIPETDVPPAGEALERLGYAGALPQKGASYAVDPTGRQVDIHVIAFRSDGSAVYWMGDGCDWVYPAGALEGRGAIAGRAVPCVTAEMMLLEHTTGYTLDDVHRADVAALTATFGLL